MVLLGVRPPADFSHFSLHRILQMEGFLTTLVMGIGYMIVPRFRNIGLPSRRLAYISLALVLASVAASIVHAISDNDTIAGAISYALRLLATAIFGVMLLWVIRIRPKLLRLSDYFIALSVITLVTVNILDMPGSNSPNSLGEIQLWLLFPVLMIFGIEYKTLPSFLAFIRPRKRLGKASLVLAAAALATGVASTTAVQDYFPYYHLISLAFNATLFSSAALFAASLFIYGGFDDSELRSFLSGEKKARYLYTIAYTRVAFALLLIGTALAALFHAVGGSMGFLFYDLAIHLTAIGFVGVTATLYVPLMIPPILGKQVHFAKFNHAPVYLILAALATRAAADTVIGSAGPFSYVLMASGWLVVAALFIFVFMLHKSMKAA